MPKNARRRTYGKVGRREPSRGDAGKGDFISRAGISRYDGYGGSEEPDSCQLFSVSSGPDAHARAVPRSATQQTPRRSALPSHTPNSARRMPGGTHAIAPRSESQLQIVCTKTTADLARTWTSPLRELMRIRFRGPAVPVVPTRGRQCSSAAPKHLSNFAASHRRLFGQSPCPLTVFASVD